LQNVVCVEINYPPPELKRSGTEVEVTKLRKHLVLFAWHFGNCAEDARVRATSCTYRTAVRM